MVGPMGNTGLGLNLPGVEKAMLEMEGSGLTGEELKEKFARLGRRVCPLLLAQLTLTDVLGNNKTRSRTLIAHDTDYSRCSSCCT